MNVHLVMVVANISVKTMEVHLHASVQKAVSSMMMEKPAATQVYTCIYIYENRVNKCLLELGFTLPRMYIFHLPKCLI